MPEPRIIRPSVRARGQLCQKMAVTTCKLRAHLHSSCYEGSKQAARDEASATARRTVRILFLFSFRAAQGVHSYGPRFNNAAAISDNTDPVVNLHRATI